MAKTSVKARELKRQKMVEKYAEERAALKAAGDWSALDQLPKNSSKVRLHNRCQHRTVEGTNRVPLGGIKFLQIHPMGWMLTGAYYFCASTPSSGYSYHYSQGTPLGTKERRPTLSC